MKNILLAISLLLLASCGSSNESDQGTSQSDYSSETNDLVFEDSGSESEPTDCDGEARMLAIGLCVNRARNLLDPLSESLKSSAREAAKLPSSCEPFHGNTVGAGQQIGNDVFNSISADPTRTEDDINDLCAMMVG